MDRQADNYIIYSEYIEYKVLKKSTNIGTHNKAHIHAYR